MLALNGDAQTGGLFNTKEGLIMFDALIDLTKNVVKVAAAPVEVALDVANAVVEPVAEVAEDGTKEVKKALKD